jgi:pimeloyl-[acyl-carrier protein] methyl ester esterase
MAMRLVLLPGLDGTGIFFRPLLPHLPAWIEPVVVSYPGDVPLGYEELLPRVLDALLDGPFALLGESFSGPLAVLAAACRPPGLEAVILCATFARSPHPHVPRWCRHLVGPWVFWNFPVTGRVRLFLGGRDTNALRSLAAEALPLVRPAVWARRVRAAHMVDVRSELACCPVPVLCLRGRRDRIVVPAVSLRTIRRVNPAVRVAMVGSGHLLLQTRPAEAAAAIVSFLADVASP